MRTCRAVASLTFRMITLTFEMDPSSATADEAFAKLPSLLSKDASSLGTVSTISKTNRDSSGISRTQILRTLVAFSFAVSRLDNGALMSNVALPSAVFSKVHFTPTTRKTPGFFGVTRKVISLFSFGCSSSRAMVSHATASFVTSFISDWSENSHSKETLCKVIGILKGFESFAVMKTTSSFAVTERCSFDALLLPPSSQLLEALFAPPCKFGTTPDFSSIDFQDTSPNAIFDRAVCLRKPGLAPFDICRSSPGEDNDAFWSVGVVGNVIGVALVLSITPEF
mmetsp:Transcript_3090/g.10539  ORF Transcript_3090/g.10539 Transcript_3090/m.10539 type:complete len:282 (-) Transcript_3090:2413-3258(-)